MAATLDGFIALAYGQLRQYVISSREREVGDEMTLVQGEPVETIRALKAEDGGSDIWLCSGGHLAAALIGEMDDLVLKLHPVTFGAGIPLFASGYEPRSLRLTMKAVSR